MTTETNKLVTFRLGEDYFAADIFAVGITRLALPAARPLPRARRIALIGAASILP